MITTDYYRLDPHIDPKEDGNNVYIYSATAPAVLTLQPQRAGKFFGYFGVKRTWWDIDVFVPEGHVLELKGPSRWSWTHSIQQGVEVPGVEGLHDLIDGKVVLRKPERWSVVVSFDAGYSDGVAKMQAGKG